MSIFGPITWGGLNCVTGELVTIKTFPFELGSGTAVDLRIEGPGVRERHCALRSITGERVAILKLDDGAQVWLNSALTEATELTPNQDYALQVGGHFFAVHGSRNLPAWRSHIQLDEWQVFEKGKKVHAARSIEDAARFAKESGLSAEDTILAPRGLSMGFFLPQVLAAQEEAAAVRAAMRAQALPLVEAAPDSGTGAFTCPVCWLKFDDGDVMHIAVHEALRGDSLLGEDAMQRFQATRFNDQGQALDAMGLPCTEIACPHCRRNLPNGFLESPSHIFSIVGVPSAGKSYYLTVLSKVLPATLFQHFGAVIQDADPAGNLPLNHMRDVLFNAQTPEQAVLAKTVLEGEMYERLPRYGRTVALPKPFIYYVSSSQEPDHRCALVFYDNAGEHFEPGRDSIESPGAQHVASSAGIFFLFDPTMNREFRARIQGHPDPQLERSFVSDQQDVVVTETATRIRKLLNLKGARRIATPTAVLIGKCDIWLDLLGANRIPDPLGAASLNAEAIANNSNRLRDLLMELVPSLVANVESLSEKVAYFPVSALGHSPVKLTINGQETLAPDPRQIHPRFIEIPTLWVLSQMDSSLVPI